MLRRVLVVLALAATIAAQRGDAVAAELPQAARAFVQEHCVDCHGGDATKGGLDLTVAVADDVARLWRWSHMRDRVLAGQMPPPDDSYVTVDERRAFVAAIDDLLARDVPRLPEDAGSVTLRRLSRAQWCNTVRDLLGVEVDATRFPTDDLGYGFDSIGDALTFSTLHLEKYLAAARDVARRVFHGEDPEHPAERRFAADAMELRDNRGGTPRGGSVNLYTRATLDKWLELPRAGDYRLRIVAAGQLAGDEPPRMLVEVDGERVELFDVGRRKAKGYQLEVRLEGGRRLLSVSFVNDYYDPKHEDPKQRDRNLLVGEVTVTGPLDRLATPAERQWLDGSIDGATDAARLQATVRALLPRLWRRTVGQRDLHRLERAGLRRLEQGHDLADAQRFVLTAALASPNFLFRIEGDRDGAGPTGEEQAVRLAYFLWASAPDDELLAAARQGALADSGQRRQQVERMLRDPRSDRMATVFAAQWLELRSLPEVTPDPERFGPFDAAMRRSCRRETELLFLTVLQEDRDVRELLRCDFTHVDARLAAFYGLPHEGEPDHFVRVPFGAHAERPGGLLAHAGILAITSNPTRTSPVKRGKWILDNLLDQPPPPPPPGSDSLPDESAVDDSKSLREQLAQHRESSKCAVCHVRMDAFGLALERFDAIGRFRAEDAAGAIDASSELPDGRRIDGVRELQDLLADDPAFVRAIARKLFVYAVGRDLRPLDRLRIDHAVRQLLRRDRVTLRDLILLVAGDVAFVGARR